MTVAARLRKLEPFLPRYPGYSGHRYWKEEDYQRHRVLWPLLADLAEAAEQVAVLEYDPQRSAEENTELLRRATAFRSALARVADQLDRELT